MRIAHYEIMPEAELLAQIRQVPLRGGGEGDEFVPPGFKIYENASLSIEKFDPELLSPAQLYVLKDGVDTILEIADAFEKEGIDVFSLRGALLWRPEGADPSEPLIPLLPPMIEGSVDQDGDNILLINDGIHRVYGARKRGRHINCLFARDLPPEYPYYAYPILEGWSKVEELTEITEEYKKKVYRRPASYKALFRDFNKIFEGIQKPRTKNSQT